MDEQDFELTERQKVLLKLLRHSDDTGVTIFKKRTFPFTEKEWKFLNSLVDGNCLWFGGMTTRKNTKERAKVHRENLGFDNEMKMITHTDVSHRTYQLHRENIVRYLLTTISKKVNLSKLDGVLTDIEDEYKTNLRSIIVEAKK